MKITHGGIGIGKLLRGGGGGTAQEAEGILRGQTPL